MSGIRKRITEVTVDIMRDLLAMNEMGKMIARKIEEEALPAVEEMIAGNPDLETRDALIAMQFSMKSMKSTIDMQIETMSHITEESLTELEESQSEEGE